ncbi:MAG: 5-(carboxyamino)imidazole ribonucleotide synthase, partial [Kalamiella piersonii]|nr:5-(carboxyamino)imidazole ribonucleotide synthase [Pantoea piersonii]
MKPVCVLGNGQLGRMLRQAGEPLGEARRTAGLRHHPP